MELEWLGESTGDIWPRLALVMGEKQAGERWGGLPMCPLSPVGDFPIHFSRVTPQATQPFLVTPPLCDPETPTEQAISR